MKLLVEQFNKANYFNTELKIDYACLINSNDL